MSELLLALALILFIEGITLALFPGFPRKLLDQLSAIPPEQIRRAGLVCAVLGLALVWLLKR